MERIARWVDRVWMLGKTLASDWKWEARMFDVLILMELSPAEQNQFKTLQKYLFGILLKASVNLLDWVTGPVWLIAKWIEHLKSKTSNLEMIVLDGLILAYF